MLTLALILDAILGEPEPLWRRVPHPTVVMGWAVDWLERRFNTGRQRRLNGVLAIAVLCLAMLVAGLVLSLTIFGGVFEVLLAAALLAHRDLSDHVRAVARGLEQGLAPGRAEVAKIVGRDPETLDEAGVARAAIESAAENFSDGVVAPAFWFLIAGLPGILIYKAVNTADSMIGYRNQRYRDFGWAAARLDDLLNWIPARLTGGLIALVGSGREAVEVMLRDADLHRSPNAGWPEAAMAASLDLALAGPRIYEGVATDDPFVNPLGRKEAEPGDILLAVRLIWKAWAVLVAASLFLWGIGALF